MGSIMRADSELMRSLDLGSPLGKRKTRTISWVCLHPGGPVGPQDSHAVIPGEGGFRVRPGGRPGSYRKAGRGILKFPLEAAAEWAYLNES